MPKHLSKPQKISLTKMVLDGLSFAEAGRHFDVSRSTAMDIAKRTYVRFFLPWEIDNYNDLEHLRETWRECKLKCYK
jgi:predicted DNA-binding protein YlxM (UPF0122 family)